MVGDMVSTPVGHVAPPDARIVVIAYEIRHEQEMESYGGGFSWGWTGS